MTQKGLRANPEAPPGPASMTFSDFCFQEPGALSNVPVGVPWSEPGTPTKARRIAAHRALHCLRRRRLYDGRLRLGVHRPIFGSRARRQRRPTV